MSSETLNQGPHRPQLGGSGPRADVTRVSEQLPGSGAVGPFAIGERLSGIYDVTGLLGKGGMGVVYDARDVLLNRPVAIKAPVVQSYAEMLRHEAQALATLRHPNLVEVYALNVHRGTEYMVMERLYGTNLQRRIAAARDAGCWIAMEDVLSILFAITDGLTAVHRAWISHRDLKPSNVVVSGTRIVLADFGLVTPEFTLLPGGVPPAMAGSPDYMAPEVILGDVRPGGGPLVDLYALGVVAFELLSGRLPYSQSSVQATLRDQLEAPIPDVSKLRPDVPPELGALVRELLAKAPVDRPESSETVLLRLFSMRHETSRTPPVVPQAVLIVDDDPAVGTVLRKSLARALPGFVVEGVDSPASARTRIEKAPPDIAIVDLTMPEISGIELCKQMLGLPASVRPRIVAMCGESSAQDVGALQALGISSCVPKDERFVSEVCRVVSELRHQRSRPVAP